MVFISIAVGIFVLDVLIKHYIDTHRELMEESKICKGRILIRKYYNNGAALNLLAKRPKIMCGIQTIFMALVSGSFLFVLTQKGRYGMKLALSFITGGGLCNLYDRYVKHHVVDYFSFSVKNKKIRNIIFNISDLFIFAGAILTLILHLYKNDK